MESWVPVSVADLEDTKVAKLVTALRTRALGDDQDDPSERVIQNVVTDVRRKIASWPPNLTLVDADEATVPPSLLSLTTDLVIFRLKNRLEIELTEDERTNQRNHLDTLNRIAVGTDTIGLPPAYSGIPSMTTPRTTRRGDGL